VAVSSFSNSGIKSGSKRNKIWDQSAVENSFFSIETVTLGSAQSTVTFSNIPQTYTHLQIRASYQTSRGTYPLDKIFIRFNSDTASNYSSHNFKGDGGGAYSGAENTDKITDGDMSSTTAASGGLVFGALVMDILDYANTNKYKTTRGIVGFDTNGTVAGYGGRVGLISGNWRSTSAITSITFTVDNAANYSANSKFALYGIKG
jgi:hypothetical protein